MVLLGMIREFYDGFVEALECCANDCAGMASYSLTSKPDKWRDRKRRKPMRPDMARLRDVMRHA